MLAALNALHTRVLLWLFLRLGTRLFEYVHTRDNEGRMTAVFFALNEREMNISVRLFVEWLDEQITKQ